MKAEKQPRIDKRMDAVWGQIRVMLSHPAALQQERVSMYQMHRNVADYFAQRFAGASVGDPTSAQMYEVGVSSAYGAIRLVLGNDRLKKMVVYPQTISDHQNHPTPFFLPNPIPGGSAIDIAMYAIEEKSSLLATFAKKVLAESSLLGSYVGQIGPETAFLTGVFEVADIFGNAMKKQ